MKSGYALAGLAAATLACAAPESAPRPAAVVGTDTLTAERLATWLVLGQPLPVTADVAGGLAAHWAEMAAVAAADRDRLRGYAEQASWPQLRALAIDAHLSDAVTVEPPAPDDVAAAYEGDRWRLAAHVLRRAAPEAHPEERLRQREAAGRIRAALTRGTPWEQAVRESEDAATLPRNGLMGLVERGDLAPAVETVAFALRPGEISTVVESPEGYHVLYRPRLDDVRPIFRDLLQDAREAEARAAYAGALARERGQRVRDGASERLRALAGGAVPSAGEPLVSWRGGAVDDSVALRYLGTLDAGARAALVDASAGDVSDLLDDIARQELLWTVATEDGDPLSHAARAEVLAAYDRTLDALDAALGSQGGGPPEAGAVDAYMDAVVSRRREPVAVPAPLSALLGAGGPGAVRPDGVEAAVDRAARLLAASGDGA